MISSGPLRLYAEDKLDALRRLDSKAPWHSLDDQRYCTCCDHVISGRQIEVAGGTLAHGPLRLECPTDACAATPDEWTAPQPRNRRNGGHAKKPAANNGSAAQHNAGYVEIRAESEGISITHNGNAAVVRRMQSGSLMSWDELAGTLSRPPRSAGLLTRMLRSAAAVATDCRSVLSLLRPRQRSYFRPVQ